VKGKKGKKSVTRKSRAKYICPDKLNRLIELANSVPSNIVLPPVEAIRKQVEIEAKGDEAKAKKLFWVSLREYLRGVPGEFLTQFPNTHFEEISYETVRTIRNAIYLLASFGPGHTATNLIRIEVVFDYGSGGRIQIRDSDDWWRILLDTDLSRLRLCAVCKRVFWARQDNMVACDPRCSTANRQRLLRQRRKLYEESRRKTNRLKGSKKGQK
jgi:hypothetical protein